MFGGLYGSNYKGVALEFEIINAAEDWNNFHLAEIKYELSDTIKNYLSDIKDLNKKYSYCGFRLGLEKLMAFHKREHWKNEKEVRILTYSPYRSWDEKAKYVKKELKIEKDRNRFTEYIDLDLSVDNVSSYIDLRARDEYLDRKQNLPKNYFIERPKIKISNVHFGFKCGLTARDYLDVKRKLEHIIRVNFGYRIKININMHKP